MKMKINAGKTHISGVAAVAALTGAAAYVIFLFWLARRADFDIKRYSLSFICVFLFVFAILELVPAVESAWNVKKTFVDFSRPVVVYFFIALWVLFIDSIFVTWAFSSLNGPGGLTKALEGVWYNTIDANNYAEIATNWYYPVKGSDLFYKIVFFPLYPIIMRAVYLVIRSLPAAGMAVSGIFAYMSGVMIYKLAALPAVFNGNDGKQADGDKRTLRAVKYAFIFPPAFFLMVPMTESLFLFTTLAFFYFLLKKKYAVSAAFAFLAALSRSQGIILVIPFIFEFIADARANGGKLNAGRFIKRGALVLAAPAGFLIYLGINYQFFGDPFQFLTYEKTHWGNVTGYFWDTVNYLKDNFFGYLHSGQTNAALGVAVPNIAAVAAVILIIAIGAKKLRASVTLYALAYFVMSFGLSWLLSGPRYASCLFPLPLVLANITNGRRKTDIILTCLSAAFYVAYLYMFMTKNFGVV